MLKQQLVSMFDQNRIRIGDVVRYSRLGSHKIPRLALVQSVSPERITVVYCNLQTGKVSYQTLHAADVAVGIYSFEWTRDLQHVYGGEIHEDKEGDLPNVDGDFGNDSEEEFQLNEVDSTLCVEGSSC